MAKAGYEEIFPDEYEFYGERSSAGVVVTGHISVTTNDVLYLHFYHDGQVFGDGFFTIATGDMNFEMNLGTDPEYLFSPEDDVFSVTSQFVADGGWGESNTFQSSHGGKTTEFNFNPPTSHEQWFFIQLGPGSHQFSYSMRSEAIYYGGGDPQDLSQFAYSNFSDTVLALFTTELPSGVSLEDIVEITPTRVPSPIPEPATILLFGTGLVGLARLRFRREKK